MERFGVALTKYYEEYHSRQALDYSRNTGYGYDVLSTQKDSKENRYIEVKTCLGVKRSIQLTLNEYSFLVKERSPEKWLYIILLDRIDLLGRNFDECFSFFRVPCSQLQVSCFERVNPSRRTLRYNSWRPLSNRYRVSLPNEMGVVLHHIRDEYMKLFPDRVSRVLWYFNHRKEALNKGDNSMISNANIS